MHEPVVIVGASVAGVATAEALRQLNPSREIVIVGEEVTIAHDRPPLSKQVLAGLWEPDRAKLLSEARLAKLRAELRLGRLAVGLDVSDRTLDLDNGERVRFSELVIATGARPRMLPLATHSGVFVLRNMTECQSLRAALSSPNARLAVVGGGLIGLEVAATARHLGVPTAVVEPFPQTLDKRLGKTAAARLIQLHRDWGATFYFARSVTSYCTGPAGHISGLELSDGSTIDATAVLVAIGCTPSVDWLRGSGLDIADGVLCNDYCQTAPHVWAVGDVCRWFHRGLGRHVRLEQRLNASQQAAIVAANIEGARRAYVASPFFWSDQYDVRLQVVGLIDKDARESVLAVGERSFLHEFYLDGELIAALSWNAAAEMAPLRQKIAANLNAAAADCDRVISIGSRLAS